MEITEKYSKIILKLFKTAFSKVKSALLVLALVPFVLIMIVFQYDELD